MTPSKCIRADLSFVLRLLRQLSHASSHQPVPDGLRHGVTADRVCARCGESVVKQENESLLNAAKARNRAVMSAVDGEVGDAINALRALSVTPGLDSDDLHAFYTLGKKVLASQPSWNNLLVHDTQGRQLLNASLPWGSTLLSNPIAPASIAQAVSSGARRLAIWRSRRCCRTAWVSRFAYP